MGLKHFILDVDGVLTNGQFIYTSDGKAMKIFGPDDNDALSMIEKFLTITFVTGDKKGFPISNKRVSDMGYKLNLVSTIKRVEWIKTLYTLENVVYMGDGIFDHYVMKKVGYSIAPNNADPITKKTANFVTTRNGAERAVAEACLHLLSKFFTPYNPDQPPTFKGKLSGNWSI